MIEKKTKLKSSKRLVEVPTKLSENVELFSEQTAISDMPAQDESLSDQPIEAHADATLVESPPAESPLSEAPSVEIAVPETIATPQAVLKSKALSALKFTLITFVIAAIPFILAPGFLLPAFNHPVVRSCLMIVLTWNLVGAALYANVQTRRAKVFLFLIFAIPLMTIGLWWYAPVFGMSVFETMWHGH